MRHPNWVHRLWTAAYLCERTPFAYGLHDCCRFAARCFEAVTGTPPPAFPEYRNKREAFAVLSQEGGLEAAVTKRLGRPVRGWGARRGDICLVRDKTGEGLGVCFGSSVAVLTVGGLCYRPPASVLAFWRVG